LFVAMKSVFGHEIAILLSTFEKRMRRAGAKSVEPLKKKYPPMP